MGPMEPGAQFSIRLPQGHQPLADAVFESLRQAIIDGRPYDSIDDLDRVPGIGPAKKAALLRRFGSVYRLARASAAEVADVPGISPGLAEAILRTVDTRKTP